MIDYSAYRKLWMDLYTEGGREWENSCRRVWDRANTLGHKTGKKNRKPWYENLVVYALYPQHFNKTIPGMTARLGHIEKLGANCIWLLPVLESPMKDEGFDISDYRHVRKSLFPADYSAAQRLEAFNDFITLANQRNIAVIFDIALNHVSSEHAWFQDARKDRSSRYRDYFIWADDDKGYAGARIIFKGMMDSNWTSDKESGAYFFHRFYPHQPDLNYRNPEVLGEVADTLLYWAERGIKGFRVDAAPYLWKEAGTVCENLPQTHSIIRILRATLDLLDRDILLLAEACQPPKQVVDYFGNGDECQGAYHFPLMPRLFKAILEEKGNAISTVLSPVSTPAIPKDSHWFTFLRCHDELTLEMVSEKERQYLHTSLCRKPSWDFRNGEGISARLSELFPETSDAMFAHLLLLGLSGNPVIYYGDEILQPNNEDFARQQELRTGFKDSRNLVRGPLDWNRIDELMISDTYEVNSTDCGELRWHFDMLSMAIGVRLRAQNFGDGTRESLETIAGGTLLLVRRQPMTGPAYVLAYNFSKSAKADLSSLDSSGKQVILYWSGTVPPDFRADISTGAADRASTPGQFTPGSVELPPHGVIWMRSV